MSRRQDKNVTHFVKNFNILEFGYYIWNPYEKYIKKSPNMPGIGSLIHEIHVKIVGNLIKQKTFAQQNQFPHSKC